MRTRCEFELSADGKALLYMTAMTPEGNQEGSVLRRRHQFGIELRPLNHTRKQPLQEYRVLICEGINALDNGRSCLDWDVLYGLHLLAFYRFLQNVLDLT